MIYSSNCSNNYPSRTVSLYSYRQSIKHEPIQQRIPRTIPCASSFLEASPQHLLFLQFTSYQSSKRTIKKEDVRPLFSQTTTDAFIMQEQDIPRVQNIIIPFLSTVKCLQVSLQKLMAKKITLRPLNIELLRHLRIKLWMVVPSN